MTHRKVVLAIDTSVVPGAVCLHGAGDLWEARALPSNEKTASTLAVEIQKLLSKHQLQPKEVGAVGVAIGPGSFTGLRIGVAFAKTFAYACGCPIYGVDSLEANASTVDGSKSNPTDRLFVVDDALREHIYVRVFQLDQNRNWRPIEASIIRSIEWLQRSFAKEHILAGPFATKLASRLSAQFVFPGDSAACAGAIGRMVSERQRTDPSGDNLFTLAPAYLRLSAAEEKALTPTTPMKQSGSLNHERRETRELPLS